MGGIYFVFYEFAYYKDHVPPHFHAKYENQTGIFSIEDLRLIEGNLPKRIISLVLEWAFEHRNELTEDAPFLREPSPIVLKLCEFFL